MSVEIYHWEPIGESAKLLILLEELGVEYKGYYVDVLKLEQFSPHHLALSSMGTVPVLIHKGDVYENPRLTSYYLAEEFPNEQLIPSDPAGWYKIQEWCNYLDAHLEASVRMLGWNSVMLPRMSKKEKEAFQKKLDNAPKPKLAGWGAVWSDAEASEDQLENARRRIGIAVEKMEQALDDSPMLVGSEFTVADSNAFALSYTLPRLVPKIVNETKTPNLIEWLFTIGQKPAVKKVMRMKKEGEEDLYPHG